MGAMAPVSPFQTGQLHQPAAETVGCAGGLALGSEAFHISNSSTFPRDFMDPTMDSTKHILNYLLPILQRESPQLHDFMQRYRLPCIAMDLPGLGRTPGSASCTNV